VAHRTVRCCRQSGADLLPILALSTIAYSWQLAHRTLSGAHRTVRCPLPTVGAGHASPADFAADRCTVDRWLIGQSGAPSDSPVHHRAVRCTIGQSGALSDSPVNFSRTPLILSLRAKTSPRTTHRTVRCTTGQSGAPPDSPVNYSRTPPSSPESGQFTLDSPDAPDTVRCPTGQSGAPRLSRQPTLFQFLFSYF
jgi:hypothetical protein